MKELAVGVDSREDSVPKELQAVLDGGWTVGPASSLLLRECYGSGWRDDWSSDNVAQHEYEVNDVWVPTSGIEGTKSSFVTKLAIRAINFTRLTLMRTIEYEAAPTLLGVISVGIDEDYRTSGATVKFFTQRMSYPHYFDNLERFKLEAMAVLDFDDIS